MQDLSSLVACVKCGPSFGARASSRPLLWSSIPSSQVVLIALILWD